jgi:hypothetical protein
MKRLPRASWFRGALWVAGLAALSAAACSGDETGTDIEVGGKTGTAGSAGKSTQPSAGTSSNSGGTPNGGSGAADGGGMDGGASGVSGGTGGNTVGGRGGAGAVAGSSGNTGNGGAAGSAGYAGAGGSAGTAGGGTTGVAGTNGTAGIGGNGGTSGTAGNGGTTVTAGNGGSAGTAGSGGTGGGVNLDCGNGIVEGSEECDDSGPSRLCSDACETVSTVACVECEQAGDCFASSDNCLGPKATPFTPAQVGICYDVMQCVRESNCIDAPSGTMGKCYCGTLSTAACGAAPFDLTAPGAPNGPCAAIMQLGNPGVVSNTAILGGLTTKSRPAGAAGQRLNCQRTSEEPACAAVCGLE